MPYVQRRDGVIVGLYSRPQPGYAEEWLAGDDPNVLGFQPPLLQPLDRVPVIIGQARLAIEGDVIWGVGTDGGLSSASAFESGMIWVEFTNPVAGSYLVWPTNGSTHRCYSLSGEQFEEGFVVRCETFDGEPSFPSSMQILVTKS